MPRPISKEKSDVTRVETLISALGEKEIHKSLSLKNANLIPHWFIQKSASMRGSYDVWTPKTMHPEMPWAFVPCPYHRISREEAIELLRSEWVPDADRWIAARVEEAVK